MTHAEFAESLRIAADWWEAHPEIELPFQNNPFKYVAIRREQMEKIAVALGSCKKKYADGFFNLTAKMGHAEFVAFCHREQVCERIVTGTKHIEERVIPAHTEEIVEWKCFDAPLLAGGKLALPEPISIDAPLAQAIRHDQSRPTIIPPVFGTYDEHEEQS